MKKIIVFVAIALSIVLVSCGNNKNEIKLGDAVFVSQECIVAADEDSYDEMTKFSYNSLSQYASVNGYSVLYDGLGTDSGGRGFISSPSVNSRCGPSALLYTQFSNLS